MADVECGFVGDTFLYNGRIYKKPKKIPSGVVAILAMSRWHYFIFDDPTQEYVKVFESNKFKNVIDID